MECCCESWGRSRSRAARVPSRCPRPSRASSSPRWRYDAGGRTPPTSSIDALWGEDAPPSAPKLLQVYVSQLRKVLPPGLRIATDAAGYVLQVDAAEVDAVRFERLLAEGRDALADGNAALAASLLRRGARSVARPRLRGRPLRGVRERGGGATGEPSYPRAGRPTRRGHQARSPSGGPRRAPGTPRSRPDRRASRRIGDARRVSRGWSGRRAVHLRDRPPGTRR